MWQAPAFDGGRPFYGSFEGKPLSHVSWFGQLCIKAWIYGLWGLVAACLVGYFYSASSVIYVLLRKEVDLTDVEEVYLEGSQTDDGTGTSPTDSPTDVAEEPTKKPAAKRPTRKKPSTE